MGQGRQTRFQRLPEFLPARCEERCWPVGSGAAAARLASEPRRAEPRRRERQGREFPRRWRNPGPDCATRFRRRRGHHRRVQGIRHPIELHAGRQRRPGASEGSARGQLARFQQRRTAERLQDPGAVDTTHRDRARTAERSDVRDRRSREQSDEQDARESAWHRRHSDPRPPLPQRSGAKGSHRARRHDHANDLAEQLAGRDAESAAVGGAVPAADRSQEVDRAGGAGIRRATDHHCSGAAVGSGHRCGGGAGADATDAHGRQRRRPAGQADYTGSGGIASVDAARAENARARAQAASGGGAATGRDRQSRARAPGQTRRGDREEAGRDRQEETERDGRGRGKAQGGAGRLRRRSGEGEEEGAVVMRQHLTRRARDERGLSFVFVGLGFTAFVAATTLAIDVGMFMGARSQAQNSADAGALAGATALAVNSFTDHTASGPAIESALTAARANKVIGQVVSVGAADVEFLTNPAGLQNRVKVTVYRTNARSNSVPTLMGQLFGVARVDVLATATAEASPANAETCVKPFTIPDKWIEKQDPGGWAPDSTFDLYDNKGNTLANP